MLTTIGPVRKEDFMKSKVFILVWLLGLLAILVFGAETWTLGKSAQTASSQQSGSEHYLFTDAFDDGKPDGWRMYDSKGRPVSWKSGKGWKIANLKGDYRLKGDGHYHVDPTKGENWKDYKLGVGINLEKGGIHVKVRQTDKGRYFIGFREGMIYLKKETPWGTFFDLADFGAGLTPGEWHWVEIKAVGGRIQVYVDQELKLEHTDSNPLAKGHIGLETLGDSVAYVDQVEVTSEAPGK
jgi:3-keto-disaccharide hydrolase